MLYCLKALHELLEENRVEVFQQIGGAQGERLVLHLYPQRAVHVGTYVSKSGIQNDAFCICLNSDK